MLKPQNAIQTLKTFRHIPDLYWSQKIAESGISLGDIKFDKTSETVFVKPLNLHVAKDKKDFFLRKKFLELAKSCIKNANAKFFVNDEKELVIDIEGIKIIIDTEQELSIIREVFVDGTYNLIYDRPTVIWDIGLNTGMSSLYFSTKENVVGIFGYEPFKMTYDQALRNIALNPEAAQKIQAFNYGVGGEKEETLMLEYNYECKASVGINGMTVDDKKNAERSFSKEEIKLKPARDILASIQSQYPDADIVAKIDCEGAEYDILEALDAEGLLGSLKGIMMEWHNKGPKPLEEKLRKSGFVIFSRRPKSKTIGAIYAVKA
ncbi:MAG: FkbM family methyltransferase [Cyanobacteriota bacterium]|nr:FkbM family methyltransferase [Cyanobacteriota bacterium]